MGGVARAQQYMEIFWGQIVPEVRCTLVVGLAACRTRTREDGTRTPKHALIDQLPIDIALIPH